MSFQLIMSVLVVHWVGDFVFQTEWQVRNKAKCLYALLSHTGMYALVITAFAFFVLPPVLALAWAILNWFLHFLTDVVVSRCTKYFWNKRQYQNLILTIGVDQIIHYACLFGTLALFLNMGR